MFGFPLVLLGITLVVAAYLLWKFQGKLRQVRDGINRSFLTIESGVNANLPKFKDVITSVDKSFKAIEDGITQNILAPSGILPKITDTLNGSSNLFYTAAKYIEQGKFVVVKDPSNPNAGSAESVLGEAVSITNNLGKVLGDAGTFLKDIGNFMNNIPLLVPGPGGIPVPADLSGVSGRFHEVGKAANDGSSYCTKALAQEMILLAKIQLVSWELDQLEKSANNIGDEFQAFSQQVNTTFQTGVSTSKNELEQMRTSIDAMLLTFQNGVQSSVTELEKARIFLDSQIQGLISPQIIKELVVVGVILIIIGIVIGL